jgi:hypothetical protein
MAALQAWCSFAMDSLNSDFATQMRRLFGNPWRPGRRVGVGGLGLLELEEEDLEVGRGGEEVRSSGGGWSGSSGTGGIRYPEEDLALWFSGAGPGSLFPTGGVGIDDFLKYIINRGRLNGNGERERERERDEL